jgi:IS4 transposase
MHTLLELRGNIPSFIRIPDAKVHDVNISMLPALTIARMYKQRWQVELFFRLVKMLCKRDVLAVLIGVAVL